MVVDVIFHRITRQRCASRTWSRTWLALVRVQNMPTYLRLCSLIGLRKSTKRLKFVCFSGFVCFALPIVQVSFCRVCWARHDANEKRWMWRPLARNAIIVCNLKKVCTANLFRRGRGIPLYDHRYILGINGSGQLWREYINRGSYSWLMGILSKFFDGWWTQVFPWFYLFFFVG